LRRGFPFPAGLRISRHFHRDFRFRDSHRIVGQKMRRALHRFGGLSNCELFEMTANGHRVTEARASTTLTHDMRVFSVLCNFEFCNSQDMCQTGGGALRAEGSVMLSTISYYSMRIQLVWRGFHPGLWNLTVNSPYWINWAPNARRPCELTTRYSKIPSQEMLERFTGTSATMSHEEATS
jgi:hypothetical protein